MAFKWYIVHTQANCENRAKIALQERIRQQGMGNFFGELLVPAEAVQETVRGQKKETVKKFYPGYMFVQMDLNEKTFALARSASKVTGFVGGNNPSVVDEKTIDTIKAQMSEGMKKPKPRISFEEGETVKINEGPFANFSGLVDEVKSDKQKVKVRVTIFGRSTAVELDFSQVEKV